MAKKRILVCVTGQKSCERLIKAADDLRGSETDELYLVHVSEKNDRGNGDLVAESLDYLFQVAGEYGATVQVFASGDFVDRISSFAEDYKINALVLGESPDKKRQANSVFRIKKRVGGDIDVLIVPPEPQKQVV